jgi:hypothetical protein
MEKKFIPVEDNILTFFNQVEVRQVESHAETILDSLSRSKSYFSKNMLINNIRKKVHEDVIIKPRFDVLLNMVINNLHIMELEGDFNIPVLAHKKIIQAEKEMIKLAQFETSVHVLDKDIVEGAIKTKKGISEEQIQAVWESCASNKRVTVIEGTAGAGKSFTMQAVKEAYEYSDYLVTGAALSWTAAKVLEDSAGVKNCKAIEGLLQDIEAAQRKGIEYFTQPTLLIVDEAGLVGTINMHRILKATSNTKYKVKVVLTGDSTQLEPVEAGNALEAIVLMCGSTRIDKIRRQKLESHRRAVKLFSTGDSGNALYTYQQQEAIKWCENKEATLKQVITDFLSYKLENPNKKALILTLSNKDVQILNQMIREAYKRLGKVANHSEITVRVTDMRQSWETSFAPGDVIVFRKNDKNKQILELDKYGKLQVKSIGLFNRMGGVIREIKKNPIKGWDMIVDLENDAGFVEINTLDFNDNIKGLPICHNFATTIYASQGQTVEKVFMIDSDLMQRRLAYVGMSRHTEAVDIYLDKEDLSLRLNKLLNVNSKKEQTNREYSKKEMLKMVAFTWGKEAKNQTALVMLEERKANKHLEKALEFSSFELKPDPDTLNVLDYIYDINKDPQVINLDYLLSMKMSPSTEPEVGDLDVLAIMKKTKKEDSKLKIEPQIIEIKTEVNKPIVKYDVGYGSVNMTDMFLNKKTIKPIKVVENKVIVQSKQIKVVESKVEVEQIIIQKPDMVVKKDTNVDIKYIEGEDCSAILDEKFNMVFTDGTIIDINLLDKYKGVFWDIGRNNEPKIIAAYGNKVHSRYSFDGIDKTGEGFPPILFNKKGSLETPILLFKNVKDLFLTLEHFVNKYGEDSEKIPHLVFMAKDLDYNLLLGGLRKRNVFITRSKVDLSQIDWALDIQKKLEGLEIKAEITPKIPVVESFKKVKHC